MERPHNPYAPPTASAAPAFSEGGEHERIRRAHIGTETNARSLGALVILGGVLNAFIGITALRANPVPGAIALVIAAFALLAGIKLRQIAPLGRTLYTIIAALAVVRAAYDLWILSTVPQVPPGASATVLAPLVIMALFLMMLWGKKGSVVFSEHYRSVVVPATPHVKYKTSLVAIVLLVILVLAFLAIVVVAAVS